MINNKFTILIPDRSTDSQIEKNVFGQKYNIIFSNALSLSEISNELWSKCDGMLVWHDFNYSKSIIKKLANCKGIVRIGTGYDNVDLLSGAN